MNDTTKPVSNLTTAKTVPKLTRKQQAFVDYALNNPKQSYTEAAAQTYNTNNRTVAKSIASENLSKPAIQAELVRHSELFESAIVDTIRDWKSEENTRKREIATNLATWGHDKIYGKAKQQVDVTTTGVTLVIDLTSSLGTDQQG